MSKYLLELNNFKNKFALNNFGYLKWILIIENIVHQFKNS